MAVILVLGVKVPFTTGGQELLVSSLVKELLKRGHTVDTVELPYAVLPKEGLLNQAGFWRSLDLASFAGHDVDLLIATKFPSFYAKHTKKSIWLVHQHRPAYELYASRYSDFSDDPRDEALRQQITEGDRKVISEADYVSCISQNVSDRVSKFLEVESEVLYPPLPLGNRYYSSDAQNYVLSVGRICSIKRIDMLIDSLCSVHNDVTAKIAGRADEPAIMDYLNNLIERNGLQRRVEFLGKVDDDHLLELYAKSLAVYYAPKDEDYGYVGVEAMASAKPLITATDSGGVLEFARDRENALIAEPNSRSIADVLNELHSSPELAKNLGQSGLKTVEASGLRESSWDRIIERLLSPLKS